MSEVVEAVELSLTNASSDKVYQASIESKGDGYVVNFAYGRRGTTLRTGKKTKTPVSLEDARKIYAKLVKSKTLKGYTEDESGQAYKSSDLEAQNSGFTCQLLNPVEEGEAKSLIKDDNYYVQRKYDGVRLSIKVIDGVAHGINRRGLFVSLAENIKKEAETLAAGKDLLIDGEGLGSSYAVFDLLMLDGESLMGESYESRFRTLQELLVVNEENVEGIFLVEHAETTATKLGLTQRVKETKGEGIVLKDKRAIYTPGRPNSGGSQLKFKFIKMASFIVTEQNSTKRSVKIHTLDDTNNEIIPAGNVTIPQSEPTPKVGSVIEVRYLYATKAYKLHQPVFCQNRTDIPPEECLLSQLEYTQPAH